MNAGALLRASRERAGLTQTQIARKLYMEQASVSRLESNKKTLDVHTFLKWINVTQSQEVAVAFIYGMDGISMIQELLPMIGG